MRAHLARGFVAALLFAAACGGSSTSPTIGGTTGGTTGGNNGGGAVATNSVTVSDNQFGPSAIKIVTGSTVTWTWSSSASTHNVTFSDGSSSGNKNANDVFTRTFNTSGTFTYQCTLHPGMTGSVTVQ